LDFDRHNGTLFSVRALVEDPVVDGDPSESTWKTAFSSELQYQTVSSPRALPAAGKTRVRVGHRNGRVFIAILGFEHDVSHLTAKERPRDSDV